MSPHHSNDDKSPLIDLLVCIICGETMKIEKSTPDAGGTDIVQYRCRRCDRIERVRLFRRSRDAAGPKPALSTAGPLPTLGRPLVRVWASEPPHRVRQRYLIAAKLYP
jgi:hypothetical protein